MTVQVRHSLSCVRAVVQYKPKPVLAQAKRARHIRRLEQQVAQQRLILGWASLMRGIGLRGITSTCVGALGAMSRNATTCSSS